MCVVIHVRMYTMAYDVECGVCQCYSGDDINIAVCEGNGLTQLPVLPEDFAILVDTVHLRDNDISELDVTILKSWRSLTYLDLRSNPLWCSGFSEIDFKEIFVRAECIEKTTQYVEMSTDMTTLQSTITDLPADTTTSRITDVSVGMISGSTYTLSPTLKTDMVTPDRNTVYTTDANTMYASTDTTQRGDFVENQTSHTTSILEGKLNIYMCVYIYIYIYKCITYMTHTC